MYDHLRSYPTTERMVVNDSVLIFLRSSSSPTTLSVMSYFYFYIYINRKKTPNSKFKKNLFSGLLGRWGFALWVKATFAPPIQPSTLLLLSLSFSS